MRKLKPWTFIPAYDNSSRGWIETGMGRKISPCMQARFLKKIIEAHNRELEICKPHNNS